MKMMQRHKDTDFSNLRIGSLKFCPFFGKWNIKEEIVKEGFIFERNEYEEFEIDFEDLDKKIQGLFPIASGVICGNQNSSSFLVMFANSNDRIDGTVGVIV